MGKTVKQILVATKNKHKLFEIENILKDLNISVFSAYDFITNDIDVEETGKSFEENAKIKAKAISELTNDYVIADDSGLSVNALNGSPGIYSARFAGENATDNDNNAKLLNEMRNIPGDRSAKFICVIALAHKGNIIKTFKGECNGSIAYNLKGDNGFGYDPLFELPNGKRMAELTSDEKNMISHRKRALDKLKEYLNNMNEKA